MHVAALEAPDLDELILVPGHAAFKGSVKVAPEDPTAENHWVLQSFQAGEPPYYVEHIRAGVGLAAKNSDACLMFSGGRTRAAAGHWSEASTYAAIAAQYADESVLVRTALEAYARDSFENVQFGLASFYQLFGKYPTHLTVVGWEFKRDRFAFHCETLGWPLADFTYVGCNNPVDLAGAMVGERKTLELFRADPFGTHEPLAAKRAARNPFDQKPPYQTLPQPIKPGS